MRAGKIEQIGKPLDLYDRPDNTFVATFIGSPAMNLFQGAVGEGGFAIDGGVISPPRRFRARRCQHLRHPPEDLDIAETAFRQKS